MLIFDVMSVLINPWIYYFPPQLVTSTNLEAEQSMSKEEGDSEITLLTGQGWFYFHIYGSTVFDENIVLIRYFL